MSIIYRNARPEDCPKIAELIDLASGGIIEFLYHDLFPGLQPVEVLSRGLEMGRYPYNYTTTIVAEVNGEVAGISQSYPSRYHLITEKIRESFPSDRVAHLEDFFEARVDNSWFLESLGVFPAWQGQGIGSRLLEMTMEKATEEGYPSICLLVFADNQAAIRLYRRKGFEEDRKVRVHRNELIPHTGGCILMKSQLKPK